MRCSVVTSLNPKRCAQMAELHAACFGPQGWSAEFITGQFGTPGTFAVVAGDTEQLGFILCRVAFDVCELLTLAVSPAHRRTGTGTLLLREACAYAAAAKAETFHLDVAEDNIAAQHLYKTCGFTQTGRRKGYYNEGRNTPVDALLMSRPLP